MPAHLTEVARRLEGDVTSRDSILCPGPGHRRHDRSLSIRFDPAAPEGFLVHSFAGDDPIICRDHVRIALGLPASGGKPTLSRGRAATSANSFTRSDANRERARQIWSEAKTALASLVQAYLAARGLTLSPPPALRFHPRLAHPTGTSWPAMVALVTRGTDGEPMGIHRTFLAKDGAGKAPVEPNKMMLGSCRGGAVRLAPAGEFLMIGEGIKPAWAALSTSGLRTLALPDSVKEVIVLADGDAAGEAAARDCAPRWRTEGRQVRIARPPRGMDFNDVLLRETRRPETRS